MDSDALSRLAVVLFSPKFSENVGSTARAMANMGVSELIVVSPQDYDPGRARALATQKGQPILEAMTVTDDLAGALAPFEMVYGTTARTGGWRKGMLTPETAAARGVDILRSGASAAVVFGPEDRGLTNDETRICGRLITIPTSVAASSLNLAQAVLIVLYEFFKASLKMPFKPGGPPDSRQATHEEREALFANLQEALLAIDFLKDDNPEYWMLPVRRFADRVGLKRNEFNLLMGICRQMKWAAGAKPAGKGKGENGRT